MIEVLRMSRSFPSPPEALFRAWTNPEEFKLWWKPGGWTTAAAEMNLRVGGAYRITMEGADGAVQILSGTYLEITTPFRLVFTWSLQGDNVKNSDDSIVTLDLTAQGAGTEVELRHEKLPDRSRGVYTAGWNSVLDQLSRFLARAA